MPLFLVPLPIKLGLSQSFSLTHHTLIVSCNRSPCWGQSRRRKVKKKKGILPPPLYNNRFLHPQSWIFSQACRCYCSGSSRARREEKTKQNGDPSYSSACRFLFSIPWPERRVSHRVLLPLLTALFPKSVSTQIKEGKNPTTETQFYCAGPSNCNPLPNGAAFHSVQSFEF